MIVKRQTHFRNIEPAGLSSTVHMTRAISWVRAAEHRRLGAHDCRHVALRGRRLRTRRLSSFSFSFTSSRPSTAYGPVGSRVARTITGHTARNDRQRTRRVPSVATTATRAVAARSGLRDDDARTRFRTRRRDDGNCRIDDID